MVKGTFDTSVVEQVIDDALDFNPNAYIIIKSTVPLGFTDKIRAAKNRNITFSPEFLRGKHYMTIYTPLGL